MTNKKGQSVIEIVFSVGIIVLVLTGVVVLVVSTASAKRKTAEREKAVELSQKLIEDKVLEIKKDPLNFWNGTKQNQTNQTDGDFNRYSYDVQYGDDSRVCNDKNCVVIFTVKWGDFQTLSVERLFSREGL